MPGIEKHEQPRSLARAENRHRSAPLDRKVGMGSRRLRRPRLVTRTRSGFTAGASGAALRHARTTGARFVLGLIEFLLIAGACALYLTRHDVKIVSDSPATLDGVRRALAIAGAFVSLAGAALAAWSKARLGRLFTAHLGVKENHTLVDRRTLRHRPPSDLSGHHPLRARDRRRLEQRRLRRPRRRADDLLRRTTPHRGEDLRRALRRGLRDYRRRVPALLPIFRRATRS